MQKWIWLLLAPALWDGVPAAQAQLWLGNGSQQGQQGRCDAQKPPLYPQPWMSPTLQGIYRDAQTATTPWRSRQTPPVDSRPVDLQSRFGPLSPCRPQDPLGAHGQWGTQSSLGPTGMNPLERRRAEVLNQKQNANPTPNVSATILSELRTQLINLPKIEPVKPRGVDIAWHDPPAAPSWQRWVWMAGGIFALSLLLSQLRGYLERKHKTR